MNLKNDAYKKEKIKTVFFYFIYMKRRMYGRFIHYIKN